MGGQDDVYPAAASEVYDDITELKVGKAGGIAATPRKVERDCRYERALRLPVESLINRIARTGLRLAGSTGLRTSARFRKSPVAGLYGLHDFVRLHGFSPS